MVIRKLSRKMLEQKPYEAWNAFVSILASENYGDLDEVQRVAHLCFWYESEVQNGGHLQYFENRGTSLIDETLAALDVLGAKCQRDALEAAVRCYHDKARDPIETVEDYVSAARDGEFAELDSKYYACNPSTQKLLADYFERNRDHFIEIVDGQ
jgi:hypothetical protein